MHWHAVAAQPWLTAGLVEPDIPLDGMGPWLEAAQKVRFAAVQKQ